jgi:predicted nuclease with TOPRIM domain
MNDILLVTATTIVTGIIGAVSAVWSYWRGRKKQAIEVGVAGTVALREMNETNTLLSKQVNDLFEEIVGLRKDNAQLLANQGEMQVKIEKLKDENARLLATNNKLLEHQKRLEVQLRTLTKQYKQSTSNE